MRGRKSNGPSADDRNSKSQLGLRAACIHIDWVPRLRTVSFGKKALEGTDRDGLVDLAATAGGLAWMSAYASADAGQWDWARAL